MPNMEPLPGGPIGPQCDILFGALHNDGSLATIGPVPHMEPLPGGPIGPQSDILFGALHNVGSMDDGIMPPPGPQSDILLGAVYNDEPLDEGVMPGPAPFLFGAVHNDGSLATIGPVGICPGPRTDFDDTWCACCS